jgi:hypothetical protein
MTSHSMSASSPSLAEKGTGFGGAAIFLTTCRDAACPGGTEVEAPALVPRTLVHKLQKTVNELASQRADYIVALAKSKTLDDFGEEEAADSILKPYILEGE